MNLQISLLRYYFPESPDHRYYIHMEPHHPITLRVTLPPFTLLHAELVVLSTLQTRSPSAATITSEQVTTQLPASRIDIIYVPSTKPLILGFCPKLVPSILNSYGPEPPTASTVIDPVPSPAHEVLTHLYYIAGEVRWFR